MAYITVDEVQSWVEPTKLRLSFDDDLAEEDNASTLVLAKLASVFDTSGWTDNLTTPVLVRKVIAMLVAAWRYNRVYSESDAEGGNPYANKLEQMAFDILDGLVLGQLTLTDVTDSGPNVTGTLAFYPTDLSTTTDDEDDAGIAFKMGTVF